MKIQPSNAKATNRNKKTASKSTSGAFQSLFSSQVASEAKVSQENLEQAPQQHQQQPAPPPSTQPLVEDALQVLEKAMLKLDEGDAMPEQAMVAMHDLRQALKDGNSNLNARDLQEAETLLAVESKRLETLNKL